TTRCSSARTRSTCSTPAGRSRSLSAPPTSAASGRWRGGWPSCTSSSRPGSRRLPSLLFEIGCEELPASACREAEAQLPALAERELGVAPSRVFVGPRRLAILVDTLPERTADEWVKGPPVALRERAAEGFARRYEVAVDQLEERDGFLGVTISG